MTVQAVVGAAASPPSVVKGGSSPPASACSTSYEKARREAREIVAELIGVKLPNARCRLCGAPAYGAYCAGHEWAYGEAQA